MKTVTYTYARNELAGVMNKVCEDHAPYVITRSNNDPVVMLSLEDYEAMEETNYLFSSPENAKRILESMDEAEEYIANKKLQAQKKKS
tara:strand:- start:8822 stop:9085 length:264 start_codon:yes stop_codon:yes gene_type:complete